MKNAIDIVKENYGPFNSYVVYGSYGSRFYRTKNNYEYKDCIVKINEYAVKGFVNGNPVYVDCKDYRSAKELFMAMQYSN